MDFKKVIYGQDRLSKRAVVVMYMVTVLIFAAFILLAFKVNTFSIIFTISVAIIFLGPSLFLYFFDELDKKLHLRNNLSQNTYQSGAIMALSFTFISGAVFLFAFFLVDAGIIKATIYSLISALPFLGVGLRYKIFHDDSRIEGDIGTFGVSLFDFSGYQPHYHVLLAIIICYIGYWAVFYTNSINQAILVFLITTILYLLTIFPDKVNKFLPFDNRGRYASIAYLVIIFALFVIFANFIVPQAFFNNFS